MRYHLQSEKACNAMVAACEKARANIDLEQYIVQNDTAGTRLLEILLRKAQQGVRVRAVMDAVGSRAVVKTEHIAALRRAGAEVVFYRPLTLAHLLFPYFWFPRTHCKTLHIDNETGFMGSACFDDSMRTWRDTQMEITGPMAREAAEEFENFWQALQKRGRFRRRAAHRPKPARALLATQHPEEAHYTLYHAFLRTLRQAERDITIATPYFFPPRRVRQALKNAARRGVRVTLLLSQKTDTQLGDATSRSLARVWKRQGMRVLFYQPTVLHAKYALVDESWGTLGSCNFDYLSLRCNREANIVLQKPEHMQELRAQMDEDMRHCSESLPAPPWNERVTGALGALIMRLV